MTTFNREKFAHEVLAQCKVRHATLRDIAGETGVSVSTLSRITHLNTAPDADSLAALVAYFGLDFQQFIEGTMSPVVADERIEVAKALETIQRYVGGHEERMSNGSESTDLPYIHTCHNCHMNYTARDPYVVHDGEVYCWKCKCKLSPYRKGQKW